MLQNFMPNFQRLITGGVLDMFSATAMFSATFVHPFATVAFACAAALPALGLPSGERGRGGLDLLLATRLERAELVRTVFLFQVAVAGLMSLVPLLAAWVGSNIAGASHLLDFGRFALVSVKAFLLISWMGALALLLSVLCRDRGQTARYYGMLVFGFLLVQLTAELWADGKWLAWFNPFGFYRVPFVLAGGDGFFRDGFVLLTTALVLATISVRRERASREA